MPSSRRRLVAVFAAAALSVGGLAGLAPGSPPAHATVSSAPGDGARERVIVQLEGKPALRRFGTSVAGQALASARQQIRAGQRDVLTAARTAGVDVRELHSYTDLIDAVALSVPTGDVDRLRGLPGVRAVYPDTPMRPSTDISVPMIGAPKLWKRTDGDGRKVRGEGVTVAIIDTGVDYTLEDLGGGFGAGHKVVAGYDFVDGDPDPMDEDGHGTHVAGIVAGDGDVTGVAPGATLTAYRVMTGLGGYESDIIAGLEAAVAPDNPHRADVVNMSLGGPGDGTEPIGQAATAATQQGVVVVASAGNSGPAPETIGTPAAADGVISVGASISGYRAPTMHIVSPVRELLQGYRAPYSANPPEETVTAELVDVGQGTPEDWEEAGDVTGKIVALETFIPPDISLASPYNVEVAREAEERGAIGLIGYLPSGLPVAADAGPKGPGSPAASSDPSGLADVPLGPRDSGDSFRLDRIVVMGIEPLQWRNISAMLAEGPVEISISGEDLTDRVAAFSSQGPTTRYTLEPDIVAPGVEIRSTWPSAFWEPGEFRISGTSMAGPHVAGAAALLRQLRPNDAVVDTAGALIGSAKTLKGLGPTIQGAGRLQVARAANAVVTARPVSLSMGLASLSRDTVDETGTVRLYNHSDRPVSMTLRVRRAPKSPGSVTVSPASLTIPAGGSAPVTVRVSAPRPDADADLSGWVIADVEGAPDVRVPYLLSVRPLYVQASPDPSAGTSGVFVWSPVPLRGAPVLELRSPQGEVTEIPMTLDHDTWYRATVTASKPGVHQLTARAWTVEDDRLLGHGTLEVLAEDGGPGDGRWEPIGPNGAAGWLSTTPADASTLTVSQYLKAAPWVTDDGGRTWREAGRLPVAAGTGTLIIDDDDPDRMWRVVNGRTGGYFDILLDPTYQGKVLRTDDGGRTWTETDFPDSHVYAFVSDPDRSVLVAVTADAVVLSTDGGQTWAGYASPIAGEELIGAGIGDGDLYLADYDGVWSVRGIRDGVPDTHEEVYERQGDSSLRGMVADDEFVGVLEQDNRFVGSRDDGRTWETIHQFPQFGPWSIVMRDGAIMVGTYDEANYVSRDYGQTWAEVPRPLSGPVEIDFTPWQDDSLLVASDGAGVFRTGADGSGPARIGVPGVLAYATTVSEGKDGRPVLLTGTDSDVYRTALPTGPKASPEWGLSGYEGYIGTTVPDLETSPHDPGVVWKTRLDATSAFWVHRSGDGGETWEAVGRDIGITSDLEVSPHDPQRVVVVYTNRNGSGLFLTRDGGETWRKYQHPDKGLTDIAFDPAHPDRLWLGSATGLYRSDDFGETATRVAAGRISALAVKGKRIIAGGQGRILVSANGGETFQTADTGGLPMWVSEIIPAPSSPGTWYAATTRYAAAGLVKGGRGVLRSTDGGRTWVNVSNGLQNLAVESLVASPGGRWLYAGTYYGGMYRLRIR